MDLDYVIRQTLVTAQRVQFGCDTWSHSLKVWSNVLAWPFFENPHEPSERNLLLITHFFSQYDDFIHSFYYFIQHWLQNKWYVLCLTPGCSEMNKRSVLTFAFYLGIFQSAYFPFSTHCCVDI